VKEEDNIREGKKKEKNEESLRMLAAKTNLIRRKKGVQIVNEVLLIGIQAAQGQR